MSELTVFPGDRVEAVGTVVRVGAGFGIAFDRSGDPRSDLLHEPTAGIVPVVSASPTRTPWQDFVGVRVTAHGTWSGEVITDAWAGPPAEYGDVIPDWMAPTTVPVEGSRPAAPAPEQRHVDEVTAAEEPLWADGTILWRLVTSKEVRIATHDAERVTAELGSIYGRRLRAVQSPWTREQYHRADAFWRTAEQAGVLFSVARGLTDAGHVSLHVGITRLDGALATGLTGVPADLLSVDALVRPG